MVDTSKFEVGHNPGVSEGHVIYRKDPLELIPYPSPADKELKRPILIITPLDNTFYVWNLASKLSLINYLLEQGHPIFIASGRNERVPCRSLASAASAIGPS